MLFNSFEFAIFFPIVVLLYWLLPLRLQNKMLLVASYIFYGSWDWRFLSLIFISTFIDYIVGLKIDSLGSSKSDYIQRRKKRYLIVSICTNLGILGFFKYFNFFTDSLGLLLAGFHLNPDIFYLNIILPVGISFYTFQTMSYTIDIYRGQMKPTRNFLDFALYVAFFPQLVAGPIERAKALLPRIQNERTFSRLQFFEGLHLIMLGLFKKVYVADNLAPIVDKIFNLPNPTGFEVMVGGWAFAFQVYGDFSGYSDIARGCAKCMGIELMVNFNHPYVAENPVQRWQRWHISLSSWLRDYLYIPLGGSRNGELKTYRNLGITMLLGGLWHGAGWNFVLWGAWEGVLLIAHRLLRPWMDTITFYRHFIPGIFRRLVKIAIMFNLVSFGLIIFRGKNLGHIGEILWNIIVWKGSADLSLVVSVLYFVLPLISYELLQYSVSQDRFDRIVKVPVYARAVLYGIMFYMFALCGASAKSFIYFQF